MWFWTTLFFLLFNLGIGVYAGYRYRQQKPQKVKGYHIWLGLLIWCALGVSYDAARLLGVF